MSTGVQLAQSSKTVVDKGTSLSEPKPHGSRRRKKLPVSGRGLKMLRHAADYLANEIALCDSESLQIAGTEIEDPRLKAIQILTEVHCSCPKAIPRLQRIAFWLLRNHFVCDDFDNVAHSSELPAQDDVPDRAGFK